jgi:hypothetical protein
MLTRHTTATRPGCGPRSTQPGLSGPGTTTTSWTVGSTCGCCAPWPDSASHWTTCARSRCSPHRSVDLASRADQRTGRGGLTGQMQGENSSQAPAQLSRGLSRSRLTTKMISGRTRTLGRESRLGRASLPEGAAIVGAPPVAGPARRRRPWGERRASRLPRGRRHVAVASAGPGTRVGCPAAAPGGRWPAGPEPGRAPRASNACRSPAARAAGSARRPPAEPAGRDATPGSTGPILRQPAPQQHGANGAARNGRQQHRAPTLLSRAPSS